MKRRNRGRQAESEPGGADLGVEIMTLREVADYLHCHYMTIYKLIEAGGLPGFRLGSDWRFRRSDLEKWIENKTVVASESEPQDEPKKGKAVKPPRKPKPKPSRRAKGRRV